MRNQKPRGEVVPVEVPEVDGETGSLIRPMSQLLGAMEVFTSLPISTQQQKDHLVNIMNAKCVRMRDQAGTPFLCSHLLAHHVQWTDKESGELVDSIRTLFISPTGAVYASLSQTIRSGIGRIAAARGAPPWNPPLRLLVESDFSSNDRNIYRVLLLPNDGDETSQTAG